MSDLSERLPHYRGCKKLLWGQECNCPRQLAVDRIEELHDACSEMRDRYSARCAENERLTDECERLKAAMWSYLRPGEPMPTPLAAVEGNERLRATLEMIERTILGTEDQFKAIAREALAAQESDDD